MSTAIDTPIAEQRAAAFEQTHMPCKSSEFGSIPVDWQVRTLDELEPFITSGSRGWAKFYSEAGKPFVRITNLSRESIYLELSSLRFVRIPSGLAEAERTAVYDGDILISITADIGIIGFVDERLAKPAYINQHVALVRLKPDAADSRFLSYFWASERSQRLFRGLTDQGAKAGMSLEKLLRLPFAAPKLREQRAIAAALADVDASISGLDKLIAKKRAIKLATMQQLLTGKTRLKGFSGRWTTVRIGEIARQCSERNIAGTPLPVLTCSKHFGFVDSLGYFKNQVFSKDLTGYKLIRRGQLGYPANHIEEGSIGYQDAYDLALVSPIYVVISPSDDVNGIFLHRLLKLDSYRQKFAAATNASVDRRGSLRWPTFSETLVTLPPAEEQNAISEVLVDLEAEVAALDRRRDKMKSLKQGMMQQLLTGRIRLVQPEVLV